MSPLDLLPTWRAWLTFALLVAIPLVLAWFVARDGTTSNTLAITDDTGHTSRVDALEDCHASRRIYDPCGH